MWSGDFTVLGGALFSFSPIAPGPGGESESNERSSVPICTPEECRAALIRRVQSRDLRTPVSIDQRLVGQNVPNAALEQRISRVKGFARTKRAIELLFREHPQPATERGRLSYPVSA